VVYFITSKTKAVTKTVVSEVFRESAAGASR